MYSQMANIAQNAAQAQDGGKFAEAMQQQNIVRENLEEAERVSRPASDESEAQSRAVKNDGSSPSHGESEEKGKGGEREKKNEGRERAVRESYIGQHIDITR
jgi:hypothetical protein